MENKKILVNYVLILSGILFILLLATFIISSRSNQSNKSNQTQLNQPTPTSYLLNSKNKKLSPSFTFTPSSSLTFTPSPSLITASKFTGVKEIEVDPEIAAQANQSFELKKLLPLKRGNLKIDFDYEKDVFVLSPINDQVIVSDEEKEDFLNYLKKKYPNLDPQKIIFSPTSFVSPPSKKPFINITPIIITPSPFFEKQKDSLSLIVELLKSLDLPSDLSSPESRQTTVDYPQINYTPPQTQYPYIYYPQCNGPFDKYPLPGGCNICQSGCGPTTVAMIVASYKDKKVNPITIVNQYGSSVGCIGSSYLDARNVLISYGIKVGSLIFATSYYQGKRAQEVAPEFKNYINAGKTIFAGANFRSDGGGHFFWIIDVDEKNNIWAFDPYYGRFQIPYNENSRYPFPLYRLAFPVSP